jgi:hypothetical protein
VSPESAVCDRPADRRQRVRSLGYAARLHWAESPLHDRDGVTRLQHRRKISSILIRNTVVPTAIRTALGSCLAIEGRQSPKTRSFYEHHPPGRSKTVRTAVGRSIFPADEIGPQFAADRKTKEKPAGVNRRAVVTASAALRARRCVAGCAIRARTLARAPSIGPEQWNSKFIA